MGNKLNRDNIRSFMNTNSNSLGGGKPTKIGGGEEEGLVLQVEKCGENNMNININNNASSLTLIELYGGFKKE